MEKAFFDQFERFKLIADALQLVEIPQDAWVVDVGGSPGTLARSFPQWRIVTADFSLSGHRPYVRASGTALPFHDNAVEACASTDVLEHVPVAQREAFLSEMVRISKRMAVITCPFDTPGVQLAEEKLMSFECDKTTATYMWLAQHAECGLPDLPTTWHQLQETGAACVALAGGDVAAWFVLFATQSLSERLHGGADAVSDFMAAYNRLFARTGAATPYRYLMVAFKDGQIPPAFQQPPFISSLEDLPLPDNKIARSLESAGILFTGLQQALNAQFAASELPDALDLQTIEALEERLIQQERLLQQSTQIQLSVAQRATMLVKRRLKMLFDRR